MNILVLGSGNATRSIFLESFLTHRSGGWLTAYSAGSQPAGKVHPQALRLLEENDFPIDHLRSKSWSDFSGPDASDLDIVITVGGIVATEECPFGHHAPIHTHWGVDDPAVAPSPARNAAFQKTFETLLERAMAFLALDVVDMDHNALTQELTRIGTLSHDQTFL